LIQGADFFYVQAQTTQKSGTKIMYFPDRRGGGAYATCMSTPLNLPRGNGSLPLTKIFAERTELRLEPHEWQSGITTTPHLCSITWSAVTSLTSLYNMPPCWRYT